jgi:transcription elongation factor Elf1
MDLLIAAIQPSRGASPKALDTQSQIIRVARTGKAHKKKRKTRRKPWEVPDNERWNCPFCAQHYRYTSTSSIQKHKSDCTQESLAMKQAWARSQLMLRSQLTLNLYIACLAYNTASNAAAALFPFGLEPSTSLLNVHVPTESVTQQ